MMTKPAFARLRFGEWSRVLVGQINRRHYHFVLDGRGWLVGFLGAGYTSLAKAEDWVEDRGTFSDDEARDGPGVIFNAWSADLPEVTPLLLEAARRAAVGHEMIYFKRYYKDGRSRPVRLGVTAFIAGHLRLPGRHDARDGFRGRRELGDMTAAPAARTLRAPGAAPTRKGLLAWRR